MLTPEIAAVPHISTETDPILLNPQLPFRATYFPLGFPVEIVTNSHAILTAAEQSWGLFRARSAHAPLKLCLGVASDADDAPSLPPAPVCRARGNLMSHIADAYNFTQIDLNAGFAFGWVTPQTAESTLYLRYHFLESAALCMVAALRAAPLHTACITALGHGMLLCGDSGAGKSSLAFAGARDGWTFTCDDACYLPLNGNDRMVIGNCHQIRFRSSGPRLFPELEGRSITPRAAGKPSIEVPTAELPLITSESAVVQSIVFLNRRDARVPELVPYSPKLARSWFSRYLTPAAATDAAQHTAIRNLLDVPIYELRYTALDWAVDRLNTLAVTGG